VVGRRKVLGLSQVRKQAGAIIQVGVPMRLDATRLTAAVGAQEGAADDLLARAAGVADLAPHSTRNATREALIRALSDPGATGTQR
jgi:hypothetical protein